MTICKTLWQHFTRIQDRAKKKENFHLCAMHGHKSLCLKSREASSKVRVFVVSQERGGGVVGKGGRGVAGSKANIFGKCGNGNIRTRARQQPAEVENTFRAQHLTTGSGFALLHFPPTFSTQSLPLSICHSCLGIVPFAGSFFRPFLSFHIF